jgi:hypothetical protein
MRGVFRSIGLVASTCAALAAAELAVTRVALYKHGVGFYERAGEIAAGAPARLEFKASEMDDVLKSLTLVQEGGDGVAAVRYDSADPLEKRLEAFSFRVGSKASLADILDQLKGARLAVRAGGEPLEGVIVSARSYEDGDNGERQELLLATDAGELRMLDPRKADALRFVDPDLQGKFRDYLEVIAESRNDERRSLILESSGGASRIQAAYLAPAAVWKSSYRLILRDGQKPLLEGWAIVDNTSSDDWENVALSLVSGLPVSIINELYAPRYVSRNRVELKQDRAWQPIIHGAAVEILPPARPRSNVDFSAGAGSIQGTVLDRSGSVIPMALIVAEGPGGLRYSATSAADGGFRMTGLPAGDYQVQVQSAGFLTYRTRVRVAGGSSMLSAILELGSVTETVSVTMNTESAMVSVSGSTVRDDVFEGKAMGDLFAYAIRKPVTIPAGQSAMLPFYSGEVEGRRLLLYNEDYGSQHPLNAAEIRNGTGGALDGGAITVYDHGGYAGEGIMDTLKAGDKRLVSYAVDLGVRITSKFHSESKALHELHASNGVLLVRTLHQNRKTFLIRNVDAKAKTLWIEHEPDDGFEPVNVQPAERTADALRFEVALEPDSTEEFVLVEERTGDQSVYLDSDSYDEIKLYAENKDFDAEGRAKLAAVLRRMEELRGLENEAERLEEERDGLKEEQSRIRGNIGTLDSIAGQQQRVQAMAEALAHNEDRIKELEAGLRSSEKRAETLEEEIEEEIEKLAF